MKTKVFLYSACIGIVLILQTTVLEYITIWNIKPNLPVVFTISAALLRGNPEGALIGLVAGIALDMSIGKLIGLNGLICLYLGILAGLLNKKIYRENLLIVLVLAFGLSVIYEFITYFIYNFTEGNFNWLFAIKNIILPVSAYNSIASLFMHLLSIRINRRLEKTNVAQRKY